MKIDYKFQLHTQVYVGIGYHKKIIELIRNENVKKVLFLVDESVSGIAPYLYLKNDLQNNNLEIFETKSRGTEEPDYDYLDLITEEIKNQYQPDFIIAVGGGSTLDLAKAVAVLLTNGGNGLDYRGFDKVKNPGVPLLAIPTTAGTGSEVTINAVFTNKLENKKFGINGKYMNANYALLDPEFTISAPEKVAVSAGMDAMVHTLESFVGINANAMTRMYAKEAFRLLYHALPSIMDEPGHLQKRLEIQLGAYYAAISLFNSSSGIAGGLSYPLGVYYKIPHGICGGMFAIPVVEYNVQHGYYEYSELYDLIEDKDSSLALKEKAEDFVKKMYALAEKLKIPNKLSEFKISKENYDHVMEIIRILQGAFDQNPIKLKVEDAGKILDRFF